MALRRSRYWNAKNSRAFGINSRARAENSGAVCRRRGLDITQFTQMSHCRYILDIHPILGSTLRCSCGYSIMLSRVNFPKPLLQTCFCELWRVHPDFSRVDWLSLPISIRVHEKSTRTSILYYNRFFLAYTILNIINYDFKCHNN